MLLKYTTAVIIILLPVILLTTALILNKGINVKVISLAITNLTGLCPASLCIYYTLSKQKNMILEFLPFYFITITSGTYHLCDKIHNNSVFCIYDINTLRIIDFCNAYLCVSSVIIYFIKFEYITYYHKSLRYIAHIYSYIIIILLCSFYKSIPIFYIALEFICLTIVVYMNYSKYIILLNNDYTMLFFKIGFCLELTAYIAYICTVYYAYGMNNYWWIHSYFWHIPSLLGAMFLYESIIINNVKTPFFVESYKFLTCNTTKFNKIKYNYISLNEFGIELMDISERDFLLNNIQENDDNIYIYNTFL